MFQTTPLSSGTLNGQTFTIELVEPGNQIVVKWPQNPTVCPPASFASWSPALCASCLMRLWNWPPSVSGRNCNRAGRHRARSLSRVPLVGPQTRR
jgi:hypothetical protein